MCDICNEHHYDEDCCCCECCEEEKELVRDRRELTDEEIESIIVEKYNDKSDKAKVFIRKALKVHGDWYDYSKVEYKNAKTKVTIICPIHKDFEQTPTNHLNGKGCNKCGNLNRGKYHVLTTQTFIERSKSIHNNKYDYSKVNYINNSTKVTITCPIHGDFDQIPSSHLIGKGCPECSGNKKYTSETFIQKAKEVHGNKYSYSKVNYINYNTKVIITCPIHGDFEQEPSSHLHNHGCPKCGDIITSDKNSRTVDLFIKLAKNKHNGKYDYSKVNYEDCKTKVTIICPIHGEFEQTPDSHLRGCGCPKCGLESVRNKLIMTKEEFIERANKVHNNKYNYDSVVYTGIFNPVIITCPTHGDFLQTPHAHLYGHGCPICGLSKGEELVTSYLNDKAILYEIHKTIRFDDKIMYPDFYLVYNNSEIWIEYNGEQHYQHIKFFHSNDKGIDFNYQLYRDIMKRQYCFDNNIKLIEIPYTVKTLNGISDFLDKVLLQNIDPNTLVDYSKLYKLDNTGLNLEDLFPT